MTRAYKKATQMWKVLSCCLILGGSFPTVAEVEPVSFSLWATNIALLTDVRLQLPADFNNDGRVDLLLVGKTNNSVSDICLILTNRGDGKFGPYFFLGGIQAPDFAVADWNNDGKLDLMRVSGGSSGIAVQTNGTSVGTRFRDILALPTQPYGHANWIDLDGDADLDAFTTGGIFGEHRLQIWQQTAPGSFKILNQVQKTPIAAHLIKGDFNRDGATDWILLPYESTNQLTLCLNSRNGKWTETPIILPTGNIASRGVIADFENDGLPDLLLVDQHSYGVVLMRNTDGTNFVPRPSPFPWSAYNTAEVKDVNGDGYPDVLLASSLSASQAANGLYLNNHGTNFEKVALPHSPVSEATLADFNGDGTLDLLVHEFTRFFIYTNAIRGVFPPDSPESPSANSIRQQEASFSWNAPNGASGFTYNIRIGTAPDGIEIVSPQSDIKTGLRRLVEHGNVGSATNFRINPLPPGTYYWGVQSINQALAGSSFTTQQVFIHTTVPLFRNSSVTNIAMTSATLILELNPGGLATEYYFTYGISADQLNHTSLRQLDSSNSYISINEELSGLKERSSYVWQIVAKNDRGTNQHYGTFMTQQFVPIVLNTTITNGTLFNPIIGDLDGDGRMDFVGSNRSANGAVFYHNTEGSIEVINSPWTNVMAASFLDWNDDGRIDLGGVAVTFEGPGAGVNFRVLLNRGTNNFEEIVTGLPSDTIQATYSPPELIDLDNDGLKDIALVSFTTNSSELRLYWGDSAGMFNPTPTKLAAGIEFFVTGDFDNDGFVDIVAGDASIGYQLLMNKGGRVFRNGTTFLEGAGVWHAAFADFDQDGWLDLVSNPRVIYPIRLFRNASGASLEEIFLKDELVGSSLNWGDFDGDGRPDFLTVTFTSTGLLTGERNIGKNEFIPVSWESPSLAGPLRAANWVDWDGDGDLDILALASGTNAFVLLENKMEIPGKPSAPMNLSSDVSESGARLSWNPSAGLNENALTYNVRVGSSPGKWDMINPLTIPGSGKLLLPKMGNSYVRHFSVLTNLPAGDYYWSVQSVDWAYRGSDFAAEQKFTIQRQLIPLHLDLVNNGGDWKGQVSGQRDSQFILQRSEDLKSWIHVSTNTLTSSQIEIGIPNSLAIQSLFYRVIGP
jgi:hypothetical protein